MVESPPASTLHPYGLRHGARHSAESDDPIPHLSIGTRDAPITQIEVMQEVIGAFINTSAVGEGWDIHGGWFWVNAAVNRSGDIVGVEGRCYVNDGITVGGNVYGLHSRIYTLGAGVVTKNFEGLHIAMNTELTGTITGDATAIRIINMMRYDPTGAYNIIRLDENGGATIEAFIEAHIAGGSDIEYFLYTMPINTSAWSNTGEPTHTTEYGWIKVFIAGKDRWILLYDTAPS